MEKLSAKELIKKHYIDTIDKEISNTGVEIELPLVSMKNEIVSMDFVNAIADFVKRMGFKAKRRTLNDEICEWVNDTGDLFSFETTWNTIELSMQHEDSLIEIANRFYTFLIPFQDFCMSHGYYICGRGINPNFANINTSALHTPNLLAKSSFLKQYTRHHDGEIFHSICAAVQTHIDASNPKQYLFRLNLLRRAYVFDALFFANSQAPDFEVIARFDALNDVNLDTNCFRDELWRNCGAPNIFVRQNEINNIDELSDYLMNLKLFVLPSDDGFCAIKPISFKTYCEQTGNGELAISYLRSLEPVAPTQKGNLEMRAICTQPLDEMFAPSAFYVGLVDNCLEAKIKIDDIYNRYFEGISPFDVRDKLMKRSDTTLRDKLHNEGIDLLDIAITGLKDRAFGEEKFLLPLRERFITNQFTLPVLKYEEDALSQTIIQMKAIKEEFN